MYKIYLANSGDVAVFLEDGTHLASSTGTTPEADLIASGQFRHCYVARSFVDALDRIPLMYHGEEYPVSLWLLKITELSKKLRDKTPVRRVYKSMGGML